MRKKKGVFDNPAKTLKSVTKIVFTICLILAILLFLIGVIKILKSFSGDVGFDSPVIFAQNIRYMLATTSEQYLDSVGNYAVKLGYIQAYEGKMLCKTALSLALVSAVCIPLYTLGRMAEDIHKMRKNHKRR